MGHRRFSVCWAKVVKGIREVFTEEVAIELGFERYILSLIRQLQRLTGTNRTRELQWKWLNWKIAKVTGHYCGLWLNGGEQALDEMSIYRKASESWGQMYLNSMTLTPLFYVASPVSGFHRQFPFTTSSALVLLCLQFQWRWCQRSNS